MIFMCLLLACEIADLKNIKKNNFVIGISLSVIWISTENLAFFVLQVMQSLLETDRVIAEISKKRGTTNS